MHGTMNVKFRNRCSLVFIFKLQLHSLVQLIWKCKHLVCFLNYKSLDLCFSVLIQSQHKFMLGFYSSLQAYHIKSDYIFFPFCYWSCLVMHMAKVIGPFLLMFSYWISRHRISSCLPVQSRDLAVSTSQFLLTLPHWMKKIKWFATISRNFEVYKRQTFATQLPRHCCRLDAYSVPSGIVTTRSLNCYCTFLNFGSGRGFSTVDEKQRSWHLMIARVTEIPLSTNSVHMQLNFGCPNKGHTLVLGSLCAFLACASLLVAVR